MERMWIRIVSGGTLTFITAACIAAAQVPAPRRAHNVIIFVADGLRRDAVNSEDTPALWRVRKTGMDFPNSHSVFPTFTTANASVIATGHGLGDTGDYSNTVYPGVWLSNPDGGAAGSLVPFLESDAVLANMNARFGGNYLGERPLLSVARENGIQVASIGKLGPAAIQLNDNIGWDQANLLRSNGAIVIDDSTGTENGLPLPEVLYRAMEIAGLPTEAPTRSNGFADGSHWNNGNTGDAVTPGTVAANYVQQQWFTDVLTKAVLPGFAETNKPFLVLFWSRDPDGTQHNEGDSLQQLAPGINGHSVELALRNADHCLQQLLDWLDSHPAIKAVTDVIVTSDHGFATITRRELSADGTQTREPSALMDYDLSQKEKPQPKNTLPTGFLAVDLAIRAHMRLYDPAVRSAAGPSVYAEIKVGGERSQHPSTGSALLGQAAEAIDGSDARVIVAANGGSDLLYVPSGEQETVHRLVGILTQLDYVGGIFVDDQYCILPRSCPGALPLSAIGLNGTSRVPRPAIVVNFKEFYRTPGNLLTGVQVADTVLQEGQGNHGAFGRDQTLNNMAAMGPDFRTGVDILPTGNIDLAPTIAHIMGLSLASRGKITGRVLEEALLAGANGLAPKTESQKSAPSDNGLVTLLEYQQYRGVRYLDRACLTAADAVRCP